MASAEQVRHYTRRFLVFYHSGEVLTAARAVQLAQLGVNLDDPYVPPHAVRRLLWKTATQ